MRSNDTAAIPFAGVVGIADCVRLKSLVNLV